MPKNAVHALWSVQAFELAQDASLWAVQVALPEVLASRSQRPPSLQARERLQPDAVARQSCRSGSFWHKPSCWQPALSMHIWVLVAPQAELSESWSPP